ncbi:hypothetical protein C8F04DRAFT_1247555 [Mycena alexandri]|uniref:Ribonuclease H1 N-terminal domain-containing protein n=1 Tax=Mycena alexandri TaxID=1745969 RepID=A0AAD6TQ51_9AGAR|nr:hypothetical protein C8F04DRAFT_1247555 [Mycena alexandri]
MSIHCTPIYYPSAGDEDPSRHSQTAGLLFYTVGVGYVPGIYTREQIARDQVNGFSNGRWKKSPTYNGAVNNWNDMCSLYHNHSPCPSYSSLPPSPSPSPPPSPSSSPLGPASPRGLTIPPPPASCGFTMWRTLPTTRAQPAVSPPSATPPPSSRPANPPDYARATCGLPAICNTSSFFAARKPAHCPTHARTPVGSVPTSSAHSHITMSSARTPRMSRADAVPRSPSPRPSGSMVQIESARRPGEWKQGNRLWGIRGTTLLFEDRYEMIDYVFARRLSPASVMETRNRRKLEAFVEGKEYVRGVRDTEDSE